MRKTLWLILPLTACAADPGIEPPADSFTITSVELGPDGARLLSRTEVTAVERDALRASHGKRSDPPAGRETSELIDADPPCGLATVFLYDRVNYGGNVLCIRGPGSMHLSQFTHHFEVQNDFFGTRIVPIGWQGQAASAWASFVRASFFQDESPDPVAELTPETGTNFIYLSHGLLVRYPPDSLKVF